jgi:pyruvate dehydrogenase E1 component alpha subunit
MSLHVELYRRMLLIRLFEQRVARLYAGGEIPGFVHLYIGEEAVAVGVCSCLNRDDFITSTHRGHGHLIAKGGDVRLMMAELFGKGTGYCKGKGGSMHIADPDLGILGANGIVGGGIPMAVGAGYSARLRRSGQVAAAFFGDGATNQGTFHESLNMAAAWKLPVLFVCENNAFGVGTRYDRVAGQTDIARRAEGYGMPGLRVDGNDVLAVRQAAEEAVSRARAGDGPALLVCRTWRHRGHFEGESATYRDKQEQAEWLEKDPLARLARRLEADGTGKDKLDGMASEVQAVIDEAVAFARSSPPPDPAEALAGLFREGGEPPCR